MYYVNKTHWPHVVQMYIHVQVYVSVGLLVKGGNLTYKTQYNICGLSVNVTLCANVCKPALLY